MPEQPLYYARCKNGNLSDGQSVEEHLEGVMKLAKSFFSFDERFAKLASAVARLRYLELDFFVYTSIFKPSRLSQARGLKSSHVYCMAKIALRSDLFLGHFSKKKGLDRENYIRKLQNDIDH